MKEILKSAIALNFFSFGTSVGKMRLFLSILINKSKSYEFIQNVSKISHNKVIEILVK